MNKKLKRTRHDNVLAGVCGGIAKYFNIDVIIVRAIWVISALFGGPGLGVYIICAILIPKEKHSDIIEEDTYEYDAEEKDERNKSYLGVALIGIGAYMSFKIFFPDVTFKFLWPVLLIGAGVMLLNNRKKDEEEY